MTASNAKEIDSRVTMYEKYRILVIGKTGNGKSSICNTIFREERFETGSSMTGTTERTRHDFSHRGADDIKVIDTPDLTNCNMSQFQMEREVSQWKDLSAPYPSAILLAVRCDVRYTAEEHAIYRQIARLWGENSLRQRLIVAFTFGDKQRKDIALELRTTAPPELKSVLRDAGGRYVVFSNTGRNKDWQLDQLLRLIDNMESGQSSFPLWRYAPKAVCVGTVVSGVGFASCFVARAWAGAVFFGILFLVSGSGQICMKIIRRRD